jgi:hypothetical protein
MNLTNMMMTPAEMKEKQDGCCMPSDAEQKPEYPWGLRLNLCKEDLEKLGVKELPAVGAEMMLIAKVKVIETRQSATENHDSKGMELQVTDMALEQQKTINPDVMYDKG